MLNALAIVWRESLEAMLVIGVLLSWIARQAEPGRLRRGLWLGACAGLALAVLLGFATYTAQGQCAGQSLEAAFSATGRSFRASEIALPLIANALLANGIDRMIAMDWLPPLLDPVWDISAMLDDGHGVGRVLADFVSYRSRPAGILLGASLAFWTLMLWRLARLDRVRSSS